MFPGDPLVSVELTVDMARGSAYHFSTVSMGLHAGTHVDAPWHFLEDGVRIDDVPLGALVGPATVYDLTGVDRITGRILEGLRIDTGARVLLKTGNSEATDITSSYVALTADAAEYLIERKAQVVGIDGLSVDLPDASAFPVHRALLRNRIAVIESLNLRAVEAGEYFLVCLPLKFTDTEAAPARAILLR